MRNKGRQPYTLLTVNGRVRMVRTRWHCPLDGALAPTDAYLDEAEATISMGVREMACRLNQSSHSFAKTAENLHRTARIETSKETLRQLIEEEGKAVQRSMQQAKLTPGWSAEDCKSEQGPTRVYLGCDGVKVPLVTDDEKQKRRKKVREKRRRRGRKCKPLPRAKVGADNAYKEFKVAYFYDETKKHRHVGVTAGNHEAAGQMMKRMSDQIKMPQAQERIALIDGAPWIRNQIELHGLVDAIGLDFYHLRDKAQGARRAVFGENNEQGKTWLGNLMHVYKHEGYGAAWRQLTAWRSPLETPKQIDAADVFMNYAACRQDMIRYPDFRNQGWQIGSGPTEAECKTTTSRIKGRGRRWDSANAESMMALAALHDSGQWNQHWTNLAPERN